MKSVFVLFFVTVAANIVAGVVLIIIQHAFEKDGNNDGIESTQTSSQ